MSDKIKLKSVTADNWEVVVELEFGAGQKDLVASNLYSDAEAQFDPRRAPACPLCLEARRRLPEYDEQKTKGKAQEASIYRFMIDRKHQGKGYGRAALSKALEEMRAIPGVNRISIRYMPENPVAKPFYASFGFMKVGRDRDGKVISVLKL
jgi:diamine N-acetyltransferase